MTSPEREIDRHRQVAAHRQMPVGMPWCGAHLAVARVLAHVVAADRRPRRERSGRTAACGAGWPNFSNASRGAPDSVYSRNASPSLVGHVVEEGAELRAAELRGGVGDRLHQRCRSSFEASAVPVCVEQLEDARLVAQRLLGALALGDVAEAPDATHVSPADDLRPREALEDAAVGELAAGRSSPRRSGVDLVRLAPGTRSGRRTDARSLREPVVVAGCDSASRSGPTSRGTSR